MGCAMSRKRHSAVEPNAQTHLDFFLGGSPAETATLPVPDSMVHTSVQPWSTPSSPAIAAGMVVRTDGVPFMARDTLVVKVPGIDFPLTLIGGRLFDTALWFGKGYKYGGGDIGHRIGQRRQHNMALSNPRAQRGLKILADGDGNVIRVNRRRYKVKSQSQDGYYDVENYDGAWCCSCPDYQKNSQFCKHMWAVQLSQKVRAAVEGDAREEAGVQPLSQIPECSFCGSKRAVKDGVRRCKKGAIQRFKCRECQRKFVIDNGFSRLRVSPEAVVTAYDLWAKKVSYRQIAHHLRDVRGIDVTKSTVERWVRAMAERIATYADKCKPNVGEIWHSDETTVNVNGETEWTWNVMDHETRFWLASTITKGRTVAEARKPLKQAKKVAGGVPRALVTDGLHAYNEAVSRELYSQSDYAVHLVIPPLRRVPTNKDRGTHPGNNILERLQGTQRERTKVLRGFDARTPAQGLVNGYRGYYDLVRPHMGIGGLTPAEKAGVPVPMLDGHGRLMSVLVAAYRETRSGADLGTQRGE